MIASPGVKLGYISGIYGIKGWIKVYSHTQPRDNIVKFPSWLLIGGGAERPERFDIEDGGWRGKAIVAKLAGIDSRDDAATVVGSGIFVERAELPELSEKEFYWADLVGLVVFTEDGVSLGRVEDLIETGANDVLVVIGERERLIPFVQSQIVKSVRVEQGVIVVDWDPDF